MNRDQIVEQYKARVPLKVIAYEHGVSTSSVSRVAQEHGVPRRYGDEKEWRPQGKRNGSLPCPSCGYSHTKITYAHKGRRKRKCIRSGCEYTFTTSEQIVKESA